MKVSWLSQEFYDLASFRYRIAIPAFILGTKHRVSLGEQGDVVVTAKHFEPADRVERLRAAGKAIVFDCADNHFNSEIPDLADHYRRMCRVAHLITTPTVEMQNALKVEGFDSVVIPDPYEYPWGEPVVRGPENILWYGHSSNIMPLLDLRPRLTQYKFRLITDSTYPGSIPWSLKAMMDGFDWCDAVIVPQVLDAKTACKSPNRVVEAIWRGRFVCANQLPAYEAFAPFAWVGDVPEGLEWMKANPEEALSRIEAGQAYIAENLNPVRIGKLWEDALGECLARAA